MKIPGLTNEETSDLAHWVGIGLAALTGLKCVIVWTPPPVQLITLAMGLIGLGVLNDKINPEVK